jgi:hypothetical protein
MKVAVTLTTINIPTVVEKIASEYAGAHELFFVVAADVNSADGTKEYLNKIQNETGIEIIYTHPNKLDFALGFKNSVSHIPTKSFAQRNYADLCAYKHGAEVIIRIDDDNFPFDATMFVDKHVERLMYNGKTDVIHSSSGWFNCCDMLTEKNNIRFYPRGFPVLPRHKEEEITVKVFSGVKIGVNAGLWLGDPDIDAHQRLAHPIDALKFSTQYSEDLVLANDVWCPINTQNTAYLVELLPLMFVSPFAGRYDDIISGYLMRTVLDIHEIYVSYGNPLVYQDRNPHNLVTDLKNEINGMSICDELTSYLKDFSQSSQKGATLAETYLLVIARIKSTDLYARDNFIRTIIDGSEFWCQDCQNMVEKM